VNPPATPDDAPGLSSRLEEPERLPDEIDDDTLRKYFTLIKLDLAQVDQCRGPTNKFGFAVQLRTLRWHGYFLADTRGVPSSVIEMIGSQLSRRCWLSLPLLPHRNRNRWKNPRRIPGWNPSRQWRGKSPPNRFLVCSTSLVMFVHLD
jgi:hypothetical protein